MKIEFKRTPEQVALVKAMASNVKSEALEAQEAFAAFLSPVIQEVLLQAGTASFIYRDEVFDEDDSPSFPVDPILGKNYGDISIWSQTVGGGLPTNEVSGLEEVKLRTYTLDSAISFDKRYARRARLNVVARYLEFFANQFLVKQERNAWAVILASLARASTQGQQHVIRAGTSGTFLLDDMNKLMTLLRRLNAAYTGGTPVLSQSRGLTDMFVSPEIKGQIRGFSYNPMNTAQAASGTTSIPLPDSIREQIYRSAGASELFNVVLHEMLEFGVGRKYNALFGAFANSAPQQQYSKLDGNGTAAFNPASEEILVGIDKSRDVFIRPVATHNETNGQLQTYVDDQFERRAEKIGWYSKLEEGRVILDTRAEAGLIV